MKTRPVKSAVIHIASNLCRYKPPRQNATESSGLQRRQCWRLSLEANPPQPFGRAKTSQCDIGVIRYRPAGGLNRGVLGMCDFSLQSTRSRAAKIGDKLTTRNFGTGTRGFAAPEDPTTAVCLLPGTELAFSKEVALTTAGTGEPTIGQTVAIFRQINKEQPRAHHDALEFPDGRIVLLTMLCDGQEAAILQLPAQPTTAAEEEAQKRVAYTG